MPPHSPLSVGKALLDSSHSLSISSKVMSRTSAPTEAALSSMNLNRDMNLATVLPRASSGSMPRSLATFTIAKRTSPSSS